ncbi:MAG: hypothetical protein GVY02_09750 [Bacteroidetes bacterium]|jgi:hypothetical protein|nr:hypothetical protein [Bacteroidota bacterium]
MEKIKKASIILLIFTGWFLTPLFAQNSDAEQRERDMNIAEEILSEIFSDNEEEFEFLPFSGRNIQSEYIPDFGVHFMLSSRSFAILPPPPQPPHSSSNSSSVTVYNSDQDSDGEGQLSEQERLQEVRERINEYMLNYAPLIRGVPESEWIRVTYSPNRRSNTRVFVNGRQRSSDQRGISVWASVSDLQQFRERSITENEMLNRMESSPIGKASDYKDLNVFASVLQTSLNSLDTEHLRVSRDPSMTYLPGLGARYHLNVSAGTTFILNEIEIFDDNFRFRMDSMRIDLDETLQMLREGLEPLARSMDSLSGVLSEEEKEEIQRDIREQQEELRREQEELEEELKNTVNAEVRKEDGERPDLNPDADLMMEELENILETYGSTLNSLAEEEMLMITIDWGGRDEDLPERTELRIKKGDLLDGNKPQIIDYRR